MLVKEAPGQSSDCFCLSARNKKQRSDIRYNDKAGTHRHHFGGAVVGDVQYSIWILQGKFRLHPLIQILFILLPPWYVPGTVVLTHNLRFIPGNIKSLSPNDVTWRQWNTSSLVQVMAYSLFLSFQWGFGNTFPWNGNWEKSNECF